MRSYITIFFTTIVIAFPCYSQDEVIRVACVGNSITYGWGLEDRNTEGYPAQLGLLLGDKYLTQNFGFPGSSMVKQGETPYWNRSLQSALDFNPNIVIILLGTNDSSFRNWLYKDEFYTDYMSMIDTFAQLSVNPAIYIALPPPVFQNGFGVRGEIVRDEINPIIRQVATDAGLPLIDLYQAMINDEELFSDGIHVNTEGAIRLADLITQALTSDPTAVQFMSWGQIKAVTP